MTLSHEPVSTARQRIRTTPPARGAKPRVLVIAPQPFFTPRGTPFSVYYRTAVMAEQGLEIDLLTYGQGEDVDLSGVRIIRIPRFAWLGPVKIGPSPLKLWLDLFIGAWTVGLLLRRRYAFVHAHEEAVFLCWLLKPLFRFKLVYDMHSSLPQQLTNFGFSRSRLLRGIFDWLESRCLKRADAVIAICPALSEYAAPRMPRPERLFLIENSIFDDVRLQRQGVAASRYDATSAPSLDLPPNRPLVAYAGTFERYQGLDVLLQAFVQVHQKRPDAMLFLIGGTPQQVDQLRRTAEALGLAPHCEIRGRVTPAVARRYLVEASVLVSPRILGTNTPLKIYEQLASGVPLVATRIPSHTQVLDDEVCVLVDPTPASIADGIVEALSNAPRREAVVAAARRLYASRYSREAYAAKIRNLLEVLH